jgi:hypothetical protein
LLASPAKTPPSGPDWLHEIKHDGFRILALRDDRAIGSLIEAAGFQFDRYETGYMQGPKPLTFMFEGSARPL